MEEQKKDVMKVGGRVPRRIAKSRSRTCSRILKEGRRIVVK